MRPTCVAAVRALDDGERDVMSVLLTCDVPLVAAAVVVDDGETLTVLSVSVECLVRCSMRSARFGGEQLLTDSIVVVVVEVVMELAYMFEAIRDRLFLLAIAGVCAIVESVPLDFLWLKIGFHKCYTYKASRRYAISYEFEQPNHFRKSCHKADTDA